MNAEYVQITLTTASFEDATAMARGLVNARLAACAQLVGPITSVYRWKGKIVEDTEWQVHLKTTAALMDEITQCVVEGHKYDEPEVTAVPLVGGSETYLRWIGEEVREPGEGRDQR